LNRLPVPRATQPAKTDRCNISKPDEVEDIYAKSEPTPNSRTHS